MRKVTIRLDIVRDDGASSTHTLVADTTERVVLTAEDGSQTVTPEPTNEEAHAWLAAGLSNALREHLPNWISECAAKPAA